MIDDDQNLRDTLGVMLDARDSLPAIIGLQITWYRYMPAHWTQQNASSHHKLRDYSQTPLNVYCEMTQACPLACGHCRAEAVATPHPQELTFEERVAFVRQIPEFGSPLPQLILTGGDPLARADLYELTDKARASESASPSLRPPRPRSLSMSWRGSRSTASKAWV